MTSRIIWAEEDLEACVDDLMKVQESMAASEVIEKVLGVKVHLSSSGDFLSGGYNVSHSFWSDIAENWSSVISNNIFIIFICCIQLLFIFFLFWTLCRYR